MSFLAQGMAVLAVAASAVVASGAAAQSTSGSITNAAEGGVDIFARDRGITVRERPRPEYEALGVNAGGFVVYPRIQVEAEYNDNVLSSETDEQSDTLFRIKPDVTITSDWGRHALTAFARANTSRYVDLTSENTTDWNAGASGRLDLVRDANIVIGADTGRQTESRASTNTPLLTVKPIRYDASQAYIAAATVRNRIKLSARADWRRYDFDDGLTAADVVIEQDDRDRDVSSLTGRVDYALSPATAIFVQATGNDRDYDQALAPGLSRNSSGYELLAGASFEVGAVIRGEIAGGYIEQTFDESSYETLSGFGVRGELVWMPTQLTTATFTGSRTIEDSGIVGAAGYLSTRWQGQVDHELRRNIILTGTLDYTQDDYEGLDREDNRWSGTLSATYLLNRYLGLSLSVNQAALTSSGASRGLEYDTRRVMLTLVTQF